MLYIDCTLPKYTVLYYSVEIIQYLVVSSLLNVVFHFTYCANGLSSVLRTVMLSVGKGNYLHTLHLLLMKYHESPVQTTKTKSVYYTPITGSYHIQLLSLLGITFRQILKLFSNCLTVTRSANTIHYEILNPTKNLFTT